MPLSHRHAPELEILDIPKLPSIMFTETGRPPDALPLPSPLKSFVVLPFLDGPLRGSLRYFPAYMEPLEAPCDTFLPTWSR